MTRLVSELPLIAVAPVRITGTQRCVECGKFIADHMLPLCKLHYEPLNEFGPEVVEWQCQHCAERAKRGEGEG